MKLEELQIYTLSMAMAEKIWTILIYWDYFTKDTIGKQLVRTADSIAANLSEGYGRYHFKENVNFSYCLRGSFYETKTFLTKAHNCNLVSDESFEIFINEIDKIGVKLNN
jgi:four helix bundle protein